MITAKFDASQSKNLLRNLKRLPVKIQRKILREESRKTAKAILLPVAKERVPKQTGALRKSIKVRALKRSTVRTGVRVGYAAKDFAGDTFYGSFLEYGWRVGKRGGKSSEDKRRKIDGKYHLKSVADSRGEKAKDAFLKQSASRIESELRSWQI